MNIASLESWLLDPHRVPLIMGVLNVTPDSFSDGGKYASVESAVAHVREMAEQGAQLIDVGGESTRPGSRSVSEAEQIARVAPVIRQLVDLPVVISIDTTRAAVAQAAFDAGARLFNDISAGRDDPGYLPLAARLGVPVVLMHMQGRPATMQSAPSYSDVTVEVIEFLRQRIEAARSAGISGHRILVDPGIGFGKSTEHNLSLLGRLPELKQLGRPLLVGVSRKRFIGEITGESDPRNRLAGSLAAAVWSITNGADMVRVHDVEPTVQALKVIQSIRLKAEG